MESELSIENYYDEKEQWQQIDDCSELFQWPNRLQRMLYNCAEFKIVTEPELGHKIIYRWVGPFFKSRYKEINLKPFYIESFDEAKKMVEYLKRYPLKA